MTIISTPMTLSCPKVPHPISSFLFNPVFRHDDVLLWMNINKPKLNTDKTEVMPVGSASCLESVNSECANIGGNVFLLKRRLNTLESILIKRCQCRSTSAASAVHPFYSSDISRQSDRICPKALQQDLLRQWSYPALIIATQFS